MPRHLGPYRTTGRFAPIVPDYVEGVPDLRVEPPQLPTVALAMESPLGICSSDRQKTLELLA